MSEIVSKMRTVLVSSLGVPQLREYAPLQGHAFPVLQNRTYPARVCIDYTQDTDVYELVRAVATGALSIPLDSQQRIAPSLFGKWIDDVNFIAKKDYDTLVASIFCTRILRQNEDESWELQRVPVVHKDARSLSLAAWHCGLLEAVDPSMRAYMRKQGVGSDREDRVVGAAIQGMFEGIASYTVRIGKNFSDYEKDPALAFLNYVTKQASFHAEVETWRIKGEREGNDYFSTLTVKQKYSGSWSRFRTFAWVYDEAKRRIAASGGYGEPTSDDLIRAGESIKSKIENVIPKKFFVDHPEDTWASWLRHMSSYGLNIVRNTNDSYEGPDLVAAHDLYRDAAYLALGHQARTMSIVGVSPKYVDQAEALSKIRDEFFTAMVRSKSKVCTLTARRARICDLLYFNGLALRGNEDYLDDSAGTFFRGQELSRVKGSLVETEEHITLLEKRGQDELARLQVTGASKAVQNAFAQLVSRKLRKAKKKMRQYAHDYEKSENAVRYPSPAPFWTSTPGMVNFPGLPLKPDGSVDHGALQGLSEKSLGRMRQPLYTVAYVDALWKKLGSPRYGKEYMEDFDHPDPDEDPDAYAVWAEYDVMEALPTNIISLRSVAGRGQVSTVLNVRRDLGIMRIRTSYARKGEFRLVRWVKKKIEYRMGSPYVYDNEDGSWIALHSLVTEEDLQKSLVEVRHVQSVVKHRKYFDRENPTLLTIAALRADYPELFEEPGFSPTKERGGVRLHRGKDGKFKVLKGVQLVQKGRTAANEEAFQQRREGYRYGHTYVRNSDAPAGAPRSRQALSGKPLRVPVVHKKSEEDRFFTPTSDLDPKTIEYWRFASNTYAVLAGIANMEVALGNPDWLKKFSTYQYLAIMAFFAKGRRSQELMLQNGNTEKRSVIVYAFHSEDNPAYETDERGKIIKDEEGDPVPLPDVKLLQKEKRGSRSLGHKVFHKEESETYVQPYREEKRVLPKIPESSADEEDSEASCMTLGSFIEALIDKKITIPEDYESEKQNE